MMDTPIAILQKAADLGLQLGLKAPDTLTVESEKRWPRDFAETLRDYKPRLVTLLQTKGVTWIEVYSKALEQTIFFCKDEDTKAALIQAGADPWSIYTRAELEVLVSHNRAKPFIPDELLRLHQAKRTFNARIVE